MELGLGGRTALVMAGSRGFGRAVAAGMAAEGVKLGVCARGADDLAEAERAIRDAGGEVLARPLDVTDGPAVTGFVAEVERELGPIDLLLLNAGGPPAGTLADIDLPTWESAYRLNLESMVRMLRLVLPGMRRRRWGRVVQITSITVRQPVENLLLANVMRPAAHALIHDLALQGAADGVTLNSVAPGFHHTSAVDRLIARKIEQGAASRESVLQQWESEIPAGRLGKAEELAALVLFLMSEQAGYITGQNIVSDGGWTRGTF